MSALEAIVSHKRYMFLGEWGIHKLGVPMAQNKLEVRCGSLVWVDDEYPAIFETGKRIDVWKIGQEEASNKEIVVSQT